MDIVEIWKRIVEEWNAKSLLERNWIFGAPLTEDAANTFKTPDGSGCDTHVFLTNLRFSPRNQYSGSTGLLTRRTNGWSFTLYVVQKDELGRNNYNEIPEHPISESRWEMILKPLHGALSQEGVLAFCDIFGVQYRITNWSMVPRILWLDNNYTGWEITANFEIDE